MIILVQNLGHPFFCVKVGFYFGAVDLYHVLYVNHHIEKGPVNLAPKGHTLQIFRVQSYSRRCVRTGDFGGVLTRVAPSVLFCIFQKVIANLVRYMQVLTLSSRHACAPVHRRPCCKSLKAGCILKYNTQW